MHSKAFRKFKAEIGQSNHFLITILIGLDAVKQGASKPEDFRTSWNPCNVSNSADRSRGYALKAALAWVVDNLDMYLRLANRMPRLYNLEESQEIANTKHSVYRKFNCVIENHPEIEVRNYAYVDLLICWRNNVTHFDAENVLLPTSSSFFSNLQTSAEIDPDISDYHLEVGAMLEKFYKRNCPSFKELATLISKTISFVELLDTLLLQEIDRARYLEDQLRVLFKEDSKNIGVFSRLNTTLQIREKKLRQLLITAGIADDFFNDDANAFLKQVANMSADEFMGRITSER